MGGPVEPPAETEAIFDHVVKSFRVLKQALLPKTYLRMMGELGRLARVLGRKL